MIAALLLILAIACRSISELALHGKLRWSKGDDSFWGEESYWRKYASPIDAPKNNWYYKFFKIGYKERWPTSATFTVFATCGMHLMQFLYHLSLSASFSLATGVNFFWVWPSIVAIHAVTYRILQR